MSRPPDEPPPTSGVKLAVGYRVFSGRPYHVADGRTLRLDVYEATGRTGPGPTFVLFHGGGWVTGSKENVSLHVLPWMEEGWTVVNVEYRLAREALAPAAAWDARRAVSWVLEHAKEHGVAPTQLVVGGLSSGGTLALLSGMGAPLPAEQGGPGESGPAPAAPPARALVNWFGITDVADVLQGERPRAYARRWIGDRPDAMALASALSPRRWVAAETPPVISVHGDGDPTVPFHHAVWLHEALDEAGVPNRLVRVEGGGHGDWGEVGWARAYRAVFAFLADHVGHPGRKDP